MTARFVKDRTNTVREIVVETKLGSGRTEHLRHVTTNNEGAQTESLFINDHFMNGNVTAEDVRSLANGLLMIAAKLENKG